MVSIKLLPVLALVAAATATTFNATEQVSPGTAAASIDKRCGCEDDHKHEHAHHHTHSKHAHKHHKHAGHKHTHKHSTHHHKHAPKPKHKHHPGGGGSGGSGSGGSSGSSGSDGGAPSDYVSMVTEINKLRTAHGVAPLTWSTTLASYAASWTSHCNFAHSGGKYGENIWEGSGGFSDISMIDDWYNECKSYDYSSAQYTEGTGHFTALVWKSTTQVGCHLQSCNGQGNAMSQFLSCNFNPAGNYIGEFAQNVMRPTSGGQCAPGYGQ